MVPHRPRLLDIKIGFVRVCLSQFLVLTLQRNSHDPRAYDDAQGEPDRRYHGLYVPGLGALGPEVGGIDGREVT